MEDNIWLKLKIKTKKEGESIKPCKKIKKIKADENGKNNDNFED